jgi:CO/xanthine dehydrogenase Mo-binding subunit
MNQIRRNLPRLEACATVGESGTFGVSPAAADAIHDAVGVHITEPPITAEAVFRASRKQAGRLHEDE